jgi:poly-gamma-glutamate synthesis protein (capsule biosynthesis protein)
MDRLSIAMAGDVMLGRGIDQLLPAPVSPVLYEPFATSALQYVALAERRHGPIPRPVPFDYVWGDALADLAAADLTIINLETAVTRSETPEPKGIHYRMAPEHVPVLASAGIDCCILANNHILDWGVPGLIDTLDALGAAGIRSAGAGRSAAEAAAPARLKAADGRGVLVFAAAFGSSGVPASWAAGPNKPGLFLLEDLSSRTAVELTERVARERHSGEIVIVSLHWGPNWGYEIPSAEIDFARELTEQGPVNVLFGHSSHHPKAIDIRTGRLILYGAGDFLNDYEGIGGRAEYRPDLVLLHRATFLDGGELEKLELLPYRIEKFRLNRASPEEAGWLCATMRRECARFGLEVALQDKVLSVKARKS